MSETTKEQMKQEMRTAINNAGFDLEDIKDNQGEWIDGYLPVYYNQIIKEWTDMPSEYNDRGQEEFGMGQEITIFNLMSLDLYVYYQDIFNEAISELEEEMEELEGANN